MTTIYLDIETLPTTNPIVIEQVKQGLSAPSNYKDPEKIAAYLDDNKDAAVHKTGLSGLFGEVLCIGYAIDNNPVKTLYRDDDGEAAMLEIFRAVTCQSSSRPQPYCTNTLVGHNSIDFDLPYLSQRMMINGLEPLFRHGTKPWDMSADDTMIMFACGKRERYSLHNLCLAFGVPTPKDGITGAEVHQAYLDGRHDEIKEYCAKDVEATRAIHQRMTVNNSKLRAS
jgi:predicted PolB exonuclease-like 3'-5' exonuclease